MRKDFDQNQDYKIRLLEPENDWEIFRDHLKRTKGENNFTSALENEDYFDANIWINKMEKSVQFGLFHCDTLIGSTQLYFSIPEFEDEKVEAVFTGSIIEEDHRGKLLADQLYEARLNYVRQSGFTGDIVLQIHEDNERSLNAAKRNGFKEDREIFDFEERYLLFHRSPPSLS